MSHRIVLLDMTTPARAEALRALLPAGFSFSHASEPGEAHQMALIADADFAIAGQTAVSAAVLGAARRLRLLHKWGVGVDNIDVEAARALGMRVARTTGSNALPVAEFTIGLMLAALRNIAFAHERMKQGEWRGPGQTPAEPRLLSGRTVGIVGLGAIGANVARLVKGFGCRVLYAKRTPLPAEQEAALGVAHAPLGDLLEQSDVVSLHCPLTEETANLIDADAFGRMKPGAILVNVARGGVVDEGALYAALASKRIAAAAMDVFSVEPLPADSRLLTLDNLVVTSHLASVTADTFEPTVRRMFENFRRAAEGEALPPGDVVA